MLPTQEITEPQGGIVKYFESFRWKNVYKTDLHRRITRGCRKPLKLLILKVLKVLKKTFQGVSNYKEPSVF